MYTYYSYFEVYCYCVRADCLVQPLINKGRKVITNELNIAEYLFI